MPRPASNRKAEITEAAAGIIYEQGYSQTTLAEVAKAANIPVGSVYYYFKTREDVAKGVISALSDRYCEMRADWDRIEAPRARVLAFVGMTLANRDALSRFGCAIGSLGTELGKQDRDLAGDLSEIFKNILVWLAEEFQAIGCDEQDAERNALHVLTVLQGASLLTHLFDDPSVMEKQAQELMQFVNAAGT